MKNFTYLDSASTSLTPLPVINSINDYFINYNSTLEYLKQNNLITKMPKWDGSYYIGPRYDDYYIISGHSRHSKILEESNYQTIKEYLSKNSINFIEVSFNHWAVGWIETLMIQEDDIKGIEFINDNILDRLEDYPVFDEEDFYQREYEEATEIKEDMIMKLLLMLNMRLLTMSMI